jgi:uncharacterized alkaline shock family protein YloU
VTLTADAGSNEPDPDALAAAVLACPAVVAMSAGRVGEVATYLPGRRVAGVRVRDKEVTVHVVARYGPTVAEIAAQVRQTVQTLAPGRSVAVGVDDLVTETPSTSAR